MNKKYIFYHHGGSGNHGCEAIVRSVVKILGKECDLISFRPEDDYKYGLDKVVSSIYKVKEIGKSGIHRIILYIARHFFHSKKLDYKYEFKDVVKSKNNILISIGGDLYCGKDTESLTYLNKIVSKHNTSILLGCSIEPEKLKDPKIVEDMKRYHLIFAREPVTYNALINAGVTKNVFLCADPAFQLDTLNVTLPEGFQEGNTIGINISPLIIMREKTTDIIKSAYDNLIEYIIENTNYQIALIPHVVWSSVSDFKLLKEFYNKYSHTGRVVLISDCNCMELKGYISKCSMFIGARTHSTIAAYSSCVPTVVVGYSVKAVGIAKDLFGTTDNYVLPAQSIKNGNELVDTFIWLDKNHASIREGLKNMMPSYKKSCYIIKEKIEMFLNEKNN